MMKTVVIINVVIVLVLAGAVAWLFSSGKLVWANEKSQTATAITVCDANLVTKFNNAMYYIGRNGSSAYTIDEEGVQNLKAEIKKLQGYATDPTCQTMLYLTAIYYNDYQGSKAAYAAINELHEKNVYPDNNIRGNPPLFTYEASVFSLSDEGKARGGVRE